MSIYETKVERGTFTVYLAVKVQISGQKEVLFPLLTNWMARPGCQAWQRMNREWKKVMQKVHCVPLDLLYRKSWPIRQIKESNIKFQISGSKNRLCLVASPLCTHILTRNNYTLNSVFLFLSFFPFRFRLGVYGSASVNWLCRIWVYQVDLRRL